MTLVDTSVWIDYLGVGDAGLERLLAMEAVVLHPFLVGELSMGALKPREKILVMLSSLPHLEAVDNRDFLKFVSENQLFGTGVGFVDAHLLAAVKETPGTTLWTRDKRLHAQAVRLHCAYNAPGSMLV